MKAVTLVIGVAVALLTAPAFAQGVDDFGAYGGDQGPARTTKNSAAEVRFGAYRPDADDGLNGTPFDDTFGDTLRFLVGIEGDWQALRLGNFASFGPGFGIGYTKFNAKAPFTEGGDRSEQKTSLAIVPMYAVGVLRVDYLVENTAVPLAPYGKLGFGWALWWSEDGGVTAEVDGDKARGSSLGYQGALGLMIALDWLEPDTAGSIDAMSGINHSYVFGEWYLSNLDGFGGDQLQLGTSTWFVGIAMEM